MSTPAIPSSLQRHIPEGRAVRGLLVERAAIDETARTASLAFASETPYERYWGVEILDCTATSMRAGRLTSGANLLCDHNARDVVGVVESISIGSDRVARAIVRFGRSARAEEIWQDVKDGIRRNVSVGYMIHQAQLVETKEGLETYRVTDWEPFEVSLVSVPADASVGIGRSLSTDSAAPAAPLEPAAPTITTTTEVKSMNTEVQVVETRNHAAEIGKIAASSPALADTALRSIQAGHTVEQFQAEAIRHMASKPVPTADIGLDKTEVKRYSMLRALNALANPADAAAQRAAAFERECSDAAGKVHGKTARGLFVPIEIQKRDLTAGTNNAGGFTVQTSVLGSSFIDALRHAMVLDRLGATFLNGLVGNIAIPKMSAGATAYWVAENGAPTESQQTIAQVTMSPKTVGAFTDVSRRLLLQSSIDVEGMVQNDLAKVLGLAIQAAAIKGGGSNEPSGILTAVTAAIIGGTNGAAPTWANMVGLETNVAVANADVSTMGYLTNAKVRGKLKTTEKFSSSNGQTIWGDGNTPVNGYAVAVTNAVPSNLTKGTSNGVCSAVIYGNFADLVIGTWGSLDLMVDPYTGSTAGTVRVVALQDTDIALRNVESFATMVDALTV